MKSARPPTAQQLAECSQRMKVTIPSSAQAVRFYGESGGMDSALWLQLRIPAAQFRAFIASSPITESDLHGPEYPSGVVLGYFRDWLSAPPKNFKTAEPQIAPGRFLKCLFDFDDAETTVVYLMWFTT